MAIANGENDMDKNEVLKILETAKDENGEVPMRLVRQAFEKLPEPCGDTIYRQAAINAMCDACSDWCDEGVCKKVSALQKLPPAQQWISCDKGEPDEDMECWVTVKTTDALYRGNFTKRYGERRDKGFITSGGFMWWNTALAWMPIYEPEPYRTEGDDNHEG